jgi:hypothetical protein
VETKPRRRERCALLVLFRSRGGISGAVPAEPADARALASWIGMLPRWQVSLSPLAAGAVIMLGERDLEVGAIMERAFQAWSAAARGGRDG